MAALLVGETVVQLVDNWVAYLVVMLVAGKAVPLAAETVVCWAEKKADEWVVAMVDSLERYLAD